MAENAPKQKLAILHIEALVPVCDLFIEPDKSRFMRDPVVLEDISIAAKYPLNFSHE